MPEPVALWLVTAHLLADFPLQPDWMAKQKAIIYRDHDSFRAFANGLSSLIIHISIHGFMFIPIAFYTLPPGEWELFIGWVMFSHLVIDANEWVAPRDGWGHDGMVWAWLVDQILHLVALSLAYPVVSVL